RAYMGKNLSTFYDAMPQVERERLAALEFDTFVLVDSHWFTTLEYVLNAHERLAGVYTSEELPHMLHDLEYDYRGDPELARMVERMGRDRAMRVIASAHRNLPLHYPTLNVMYYFNPGARRRVLSVSVCQTASVKNDLAFGAVLGDAIRKSKRRAVLIASGGMSHKFWDYDRILDHASASPDDISSTANRLYDERIMDWFKAGDHASILNCADDFRAHCSPEGRFSHYLVMAGAMGGEKWNWRGEQFGRYEAAIGTGQAIFYFAPNTGAGGAH
ncbi:MAG TPA: hypothetical protein VLL57_09755, partial [Candidatus Binataceae bacterium]|nr:hypothetical protein [Candidatus Binataceae bacterium]